jgi:hypothetical protein
MSDFAPRTTEVPLTKLEVAASLAAVRAVADSGFEAMGTGCFPLTSAAEKFQKALDDLNGDDDA